METLSTYLKKLLETAARRNAILLHLSVGGVPQIKIGNRYIPVFEEMIEKELIDKIIDQILTQTEKEKLAKEKEIVVVKEIDKNLRFRTNIFYQKGLPSISFYYISGKTREFQSLNFPPAIAEFIKAPAGLLIIAGNLGSGKTSTAASIIEEINKTQAKHILTIEESVDRVFAGKLSIVEQRQVGQDAATFCDAIKYCLKEDIDLVFINGIRDELESSLRSIMELASGNSKVILEMNADSSIEIVDRLTSILAKSFSEESARYILADNLFGIIVQKLIYGRGGEPHMATEILLANSVVKSYIRESKFQQIESVIQTSKKEGMISLEKSINELIQAGKIRKEDL